MLLLIDNYDSFTYNLAQYFGELGCELVVKRNDEISLDEIAALAPKHICISPGPCTPREAGISKDIVLRFGAKDSNPRRLSWTSMHRRSVRRKNRTCCQSCAWEVIHDQTQRKRTLHRFAHAV